MVLSNPLPGPFSPCPCHCPSHHSHIVDHRPKPTQSAIHQDKQAVISGIEAANSWAAWRRPARRRSARRREAVRRAREEALAVDLAQPVHAARAAEEVGKPQAVAEAVRGAGAAGVARRELGEHEGVRVDAAAARS